MIPPLPLRFVSVSRGGFDVVPARGGEFEQFPPDGSWFDRAFDHQSGLHEFLLDLPALPDARELLVPLGQGCERVFDNVCEQAFCFL